MEVCLTKRNRGQRFEKQWGRQVCFWLASLSLCNQRDRDWTARPSEMLSARILAVYGDTAQLSRAVEMGGEPLLHSSRCRLQLTSHLRARMVVSGTLSVPGAASVQAKIRS